MNMPLWEAHQSALDTVGQSVVKEGEIDMNVAGK